MVLSDGEYEAVLALTSFGEKKSWLLSGREIEEEPDGNSEVSAQSIPTQINPTFSREDLGAALSSFANVSKVSKDASGSSENNRPVFAGLFVQDKGTLMKKYPGSLPNKFYDHMTSVFNPGVIASSSLGVEVDLYKIGRLATDRADLLL